MYKQSYMNMIDRQCNYKSRHFRNSF